MKLTTLAAMCVLVVWSASASAEVMQFICTYPKFYNWGGKPDPNSVLKFSMDTVTNKAFITGNQGIQEVTVVRGDSGITFLEILVTGAVQSTTVSSNGDSVHSRHTLVGDHLVPSQYVGHCIVE